MQLAAWPTPLELKHHPHLGALLVKRDDLSNFGGNRSSGVKARKLEGLLAYLHDRGKTSLEIALGNITNLGADLDEVARAAKIRLRLQILDDPPLPLHLRQDLFRNMDAEVTLHGPSWAAAALRTLKRRLGSIGTAHYVTLPSPAHPAAVLGATAGYLEAMEQARTECGVIPRAVYIASAAGSTAAGFVLGETLMRRAGAPPVDIVAVPVVNQPVGLTTTILARWTAHRYAMGQPDFNLKIAKDPRNLRYGRFDQALEQVCQRVEQDHELRIDPIYGGKSWRTMEEREVGRPDRRPVLFWHCGYTACWQACREELCYDG